MPPQEKICYGPFITNIGISFTSYRTGAEGHRDVLRHYSFGRKPIMTAAVILVSYNA